MQKLLSLFLILILVTLSCVSALASRRNPYRYRSSTESETYDPANDKRDQAVALLKRELNLIIENQKLEVAKASTMVLKHDVVKRGRQAMFDVYDRYLSLQCQIDIKPKGKKATIKRGMRALVEYIPKLEELDMNNGCFTAGIVFPEVIYE